MLKDFFKKYFFKLILIIILIFFEASIDLKLPEYVSDVINIGVLQSGIEDKVPKYLRKSQMDLLLKVTDDDLKILNYYTLVTSNENDKLKKLRINSKEDVYVLNDNFDEKLQSLMDTPLKNLVALQNKNITLRIKLTLKRELNDEQLKYFNNLYDDGSNLIEILEKLPEDLQNRLISIVKEKANSIDDTVFNQSINKLIINEYKILGIDVDNIQKSYNINICRKILVLAIINLIVEIFVIKLAINISTNFGKELRKKVVNKFLNISENTFNKIGVSNFIATTMNDTNQIEMTFPLIIQSIVYAPIIILKGLFIIFRKSNFSMMAILLTTIALSVLDILIILLFAMPKFKQNKKIEEMLKIKSRNFVNGAYVIRAFNQEENEEKKFSKLNEKASINNTKINKILCLLVPTLLFILEASIVYMVYLGTRGIDLGIMSVGEIVEFIQISIQIVISFLSLSVLAIILPAFLSSIKQIYGILKLEENKSHGNKSIYKLSDKKIIFENVSLAVDDKNILENLNFSIIPGKLNAIIGETGSGKTSIINLLLQNIKPTVGSIKIENKNIEDYNIKDLNKLIGVSYQENYIFSGTLENNFKLSNNNIDKEKMYKICEIADLNEFITNNNKEKLDFKIINGGNNISGGQKQRISIANALAKDFDLLILDDSFSSMDIKTENNIKESIKKNYKNKTIILISQKVNTIKDAEQIIVMKNGKIVGCGKHDYLEKNCKEYIDFINIQSVKEEV